MWRLRCWVLIFFISHRLPVDLHGGSLVDAVSMECFGDNMQPSQTQLQLCSMLESTPELHLLISQFPDILNATGVLLPVKHAVEHVIETTGRQYW
jgi:hypothetical protein